MSPSQPEYASEDEDHEMLDYPETHDSGSEFLMSEDDTDSTDSTDAEPNGSATDSENNSEHSPENHDTESIPGIDDPSRDNALASPEYTDLYSINDLVESDLEESEDDEENEDNDTEDNDDERKALLAQYFPRTTLDLDKESKDVCLARFNQRLGSILEFLAAKADEIASGKSGKWWIGGDFAQSLGKFPPEEVLEIFEYVIPESTRVILGSAELTPEHILALPIVDTSLDLPGVYLIAFLKTSGELPQLSGGESTNSTDTMDQQSWVASGLYGGSSLKSISKRCVDHRKVFKSTSTVKLVKGRFKPNGKPNSKPVMALYCYANINKVVPSYRQVCVFPERLDMFDDLLRTDINWMARLLEQAMILLLDIYTPCKDLKLRETVGYTQEMYLEALEQCKIPLSVFYPLNHAMPLKQSNIRTSGRRVCHHCAAKKSGANAWYRHPNGTEEKPLYYCAACYVYQSLHSSDRPAAFFNGPRSRPTAGPCSHCAVTESTEWSWHWRDKDRVVCASCRSYWTKHRVDRPMKKEKKKCISCGATETKGHWHCAYDASGQKTGEDWCSVCAMQNNRDINKAAKKTNYANCTCSVCGQSNLPAWKTATMCLSCWEERNSDEYFRKQRDRSDCWHCHRRFKKQNHNPLSNKEWRFTRYWHPLLKEWICSLCRVNSRDYGCFGITISQLEEVEIRCEDCHCVYAKIWTKLGPKLLDRFQDTTLTPDRITCGNCYQVRLTNSLKTVKTGVSANRAFTDKHNNPRRPKELTWQEWAGKDELGDEPYTQTKLLLPYLLRVHGVDHSIDKLIADKVAENDWELKDWELEDLELDAMDLEDE